MKTILKLILLSAIFTNLSFANEAFKDKSNEPEFNGLWKLGNGQHDQKCLSDNYRPEKPKLGPSDPKIQSWLSFDRLTIVPNADGIRPLGKKSVSIKGCGDENADHISKLNTVIDMSVMIELKYLTRFKNTDQDKCDKLLCHGIKSESEKLIAEGEIQAIAMDFMETSGLNDFLRKLGSDQGKSEQCKSSFDKLLIDALNVISEEQQMSDKEKLLSAGSIENEEVDGISLNAQLENEATFNYKFKIYRLASGKKKMVLNYNDSIACPINSDKDNIELVFYEM